MVHFSSLVNNLKLKDLQLLYVLLELRSVGATAIELNMAQPSVSRCFARLRDYFQDPLLVRSGKDMLLTPIAERLQSELAGLSKLLDRMAPATFDPFKHAREFVIASPGFVSQHILGEAMAPLYAAENRVTFRLLHWNEHAKNALLQGEVDLAISLDSKFPPNVYRRVVDEDILVVVTAAQHPLAGQSLTLDQLFNHSHVVVKTGGGWLETFHYGLDPLRDLKVKLTVETYNAAFSAVRNSQLLAIVPHHVARNSTAAESLLIHPLPVKTEKLQYGICWHERHHNDPAHIWLRKTLFPALLTHPMHLAS
ncbi:MAG: LysR family transcriptional regulator [Desulfuromonadales bacterium]|nr:LysR family transcriptional regulator [Desulfuromonadales bacterium]